MERILNCTLSLGSISPDMPLFCGMQGEHRATALVMKPDETLLTEIESKKATGVKVFCRTDIYTLTGECIKGEERDISLISEPFWLTSQMTSSGLDAIAVFHLMVRDGEGQKEIYKAQFPLIFEPSPLFCENLQSKREAAVSIKEQTDEAVKLIESRLSRAEELIDIKATALSKRLTDAANIISRAEKLVEYAEESKELLSSDTEFVFVGGDAAYSVSSELTVDDSFTSYSTNPVQSKAIFEALQNSEEKISAETDQKISDAVAAALTDAVAQAVNIAKLSAHPIGSLYWSENPTDPAELFGGSWERVKDRFILAAGDSFAAGSVGGEAEVALTEEQGPRHAHAMYAINPDSAGSGLYANDNNAEWAIHFAVGSTTAKADTIGWSNSLAMGASDGGEAHNNMPPYETYYCWKRTA